MIIFRSLRKLFGFTRSGSSLLGRQARTTLKKRLIQRLIGTSLVAGITFVFLLKSFSNMGGQVVVAASAVTPVIDATTRASIQLPIKYDTETRGFSWFHSGADLAAPTGTPVKSIMPGTVRATNYDLLDYGTHIIITHDQGFESLYGHLSKIFVKPGERVDLNTIIGESGSTGFSTGPHLHLEIRQNGQFINPADIVPGVN